MPDKEPSFTTDERARKFARTYHEKNDVVILHSPHDQNDKDEAGNLKNYYVLRASESPFIRSWENVIYQGKGGRA